MKLYLSGPMTGLPDDNIPAFGKAARRLRDFGYQVVNPGELGDAGSWCENLKRDIPLVVECDGVATMDGWKKSRGARLETDVARRLSIPVGTLDEWLTLDMHPCPPEAARPNHRLVGMVGFAGAGKDTVADILTDDGWTRIAFADVLREALYRLDPLIPCGSQVHRLSYLVDRMGWDRVKREMGEPRPLLQRLGTEAGRDLLGENVWVDAGMEKAAAVDGPVIVTDVRFENELAAIRQRGGTVVYISRPGHGAVNDHPSERLASEFDSRERLPDVRINNDQSIDVLASTVRELLT